MKKYFQHKELLAPPVRRAAYSDRTAWLMAEMSRLAYVKFEDNADELKAALSDAGFELIQFFNAEGTQAFLAKRDSDKMAVLAFRGTEVKDIRDIIADLNAKFYTDKNGVKIHNGFYQAFQVVKEDISKKVEIVKGYSVYITGHSLGGALALIATKELNSDNLAACYAFGSPKVGNDEFDDAIKPPIYRVVNAFDVVPFAPGAYVFHVLSMLPWKWAKSLVKTFYGYTHHGDMRFLTFCKDSAKVKVIANYNELFRLFEFVSNAKKGVEHHAIDAYCQKLGQYALKRLKIE